jgi:putative transposase
MSTKEPFDYDGTKKKALEQLRSGKCLFGKDGAFVPMCLAQRQIMQTLPD